MFKRADKSGNGPMFFLKFLRWGCYSHFFFKFSIEFLFFDSEIFFQLVELRAHKFAVSRNQVPLSANLNCSDDFRGIGK